MVFGRGITVTIFHESPWMKGTPKPGHHTSLAGNLRTGSKKGVFHGATVWTSVSGGCRGTSTVLGVCRVLSNVSGL